MSTFFFILTPFGYFCTENGTGLVTGTIFLLLGILFKWIENGGLEPKVRVSSKDWWETNYRRNMARGLGHKVSMDMADYTTRTNHCHMPSDDEKEKVAKSMGVVTDRAKQDIRDHWDRVQVGKYYLMGELIEKYDLYLRTDKRWDLMTPVYYIKASREALKLVWNDTIGDYHTLRKYKKTVEETWDSLTSVEKNEAREWVNEYEERFLKEIHDYLESGIKPPTIAKHFNHDGRDIVNFNIKYGFTIDMNLCI